MAYAIKKNWKFIIFEKLYISVNFKIYENYSI